MIGEENEKHILFIKMFVVSVTYIIIGLCLLLFIGISKVDALSTTYGLYSVSIGNDTSGTSANAPINTWFNYGPNLNYINGYFTGHNGSFNAHILIELNYGEVVNPNSNAQIVILAYLDNNLLSGSSGNCPKVGTGKYNCDLYVSGSNDSNTNVLALQLKTIGTYYTNHVISVRVSGSVTYDDSTANLNNGSFNQGISSINSNISGASSEIIGNQNQNTQDIINNQNANSQDQINAIEKQNLKCTTYNYQNEPKSSTTGYLLNTGDINSSNVYKVSEYVILNKEKNYTLTKNGDSWGTVTSYCLYNENKERIGCYNYGSNTNWTITNASYIRYSIYTGNNQGQNINFTGEYCYNMLDKQNQTQQQQNDYLMDTTPADANIISGIQVTADTPISSLLTIPIRLIQSFLGNINGQCADYSFGSLYGTELKLKCSDIRYIPTLLGNAYTIIDYLMCFFMIYNIFQLLVTAWNTITTLKDDFHNIYETKTWGNGEGFDS